MIVVDVPRRTPNSVRHGPTRTVVERIPVPSSSIASERANVSRPAFVPAYTPWRGRALRTASEVMNTMSPAALGGPQGAGWRVACTSIGPMRFVVTSRSMDSRTHLVQPTRRRQPGVVHDDVDDAEFRFTGREHCVHRLPRPTTSSGWTNASRPRRGPRRPSPRGGRGDGRRSRLTSPVGRARPRGPSDPRRCAGHQGYPAAMRPIHSLSWPVV